MSWAFATVGRPVSPYFATVAERRIGDFNVQKLANAALREGGRMRRSRH